MNRIFIDAPALGTVRAGVTGRTEAELVRSDGTVLRTKGKMVMKTVEKDRIEYVITNRTSDGKAQPDQTVLMERRK
jgi:hypothetical protein